MDELADQPPRPEGQMVHYATITHARQRAPWFRPQIARERLNPARAVLIDWLEARLS
jgi:hypothetical protein